MLGKILVSVELLLRKVDEWEVFASHRVSLSLQIVELKKLIGDWRELELLSWNNLLHYKIHTYSVRATRSWFPLRRILQGTPILTDSEISNSSIRLYLSLKHKEFTSSWINLVLFAPWWLHKPSSMKIVEKLSQQSTVSTVETMNEASYLRKIFSVADSFLRQSNVGEFPMRLHLVRLFTLQLVQQYLVPVPDHPSNDFCCKRSLAVLLYNLWQYFHQFLPLIRALQVQAREPLQNRLRDEVKMGKWDKMSVYGLVEHSERVHRKLNRFLTTYCIDCLDLTVDVVIKNHLASEDARLNTLGVKVSSCVDPVPCLSIPPLSSIFPILESSNSSISMHDKVLSDHAIEAQMCKRIPVSNITVGNNSDTNRDWKLYRRAQNYLNQLLDVPQNILVSPETDNVNNSDQSLVVDIKSCSPRDFTGMVRYGLVGAMLAESLCCQIFDRINELRADGVSKLMKQRALSNLFETLKYNGISSHHGSVPSQVKDPMMLLAGSVPPLPCEVASDLQWSFSEPSSVFQRAEGYFYKNITELERFRSIIAAGVLRAPNATGQDKDLTEREKRLLLAYCENLFQCSLKLRSCLGAGIADFKAFTNAVMSAQNCMSTATEQSKDKSEEYSEYVHKSSSCLLYRVIETEHLLTTARKAYNVENIESCAATPSVNSVDIDVTLRIFGELNKFLSILYCHSVSSSATTRSNTQDTCVTLLDGYVSQPPSANADVYNGYEIVQDLEAKYQQLTNMRVTLGLLVSFELADHLLDDLNNFIYKVHEYESQITLSQSRDSIHIEQVLVNHTAVESPEVDGETVLNRCVNNCLISVQKLIGIADQELLHSVIESSGTQSRRKKLFDVFGEEISIDNMIFTQDEDSSTSPASISLDVGRISLSASHSLAGLAVSSLQLGRLTNDLMLITSRNSVTDEKWQTTKAMFQLMTDTASALINDISRFTTSIHILNSFDFTMSLVAFINQVVNFSTFCYVFHRHWRLVVTALLNLKMKKMMLRTTEMPLGNSLVSLRRKMALVWDTVRVVKMSAIKLTTKINS